MDKNQQVLRESIVRRLSAPDELDEPLRLQPMRGWPVVVALLLVAAAAGLWAFFAGLPVSLEGIGVTERGRAVLFVAPGDHLLRSGIPVQLEASLAAGPSFRAAGRLVSVSSAPVDRQALEAVLGDEDLARDLYRRGLRWRVDVRLTEGAEPTVGLPVRGVLEVDRKRPIEGLLPGLGTEEKASSTGGEAGS